MNSLFFVSFGVGFLVSCYFLWLLIIKEFGWKKFIILFCINHLLLVLVFSLVEPTVWLALKDLEVNRLLGLFASPIALMITIYGAVFVQGTSVTYLNSAVWTFLIEFVIFILLIKKYLKINLKKSSVILLALYFWSFFVYMSMYFFIVFAGR